MGKHFESEREPLNRDIFKKYDQTVYKAMIIRHRSVVSSKGKLMIKKKTVTKTVHVLSLIYSRFLRLIEA